MRALGPFLLVCQSECLPGQSEALGCEEVRGFAEAARAAADPRVDAPRRLVVVAPSPRAARFLGAWAEDEVGYRRRVLVRSASGDELSVTATLASYGYGVEASLAVESVTRDDLRESGVRLRVDVPVSSYAE